MIWELSLHVSLVIKKSGGGGKWLSQEAASILGLYLFNESQTNEHLMLIFTGNDFKNLAINVSLGPGAPLQAST